MKALLRHPFVLVPPLFYGYTMLPTLGYGDTAIIVDNAQRAIVDSHVNTHAALVLATMALSHLPFGDLAWRANLVSVVFGALTVISFYRVLFEELKSRLPAALAAGMLM